MSIRHIGLTSACVIALVASDPRAAVGSLAQASTKATSGADDARPALAALDAIAPQEWLTTSSVVLLERVVQASSKGALDEAARTDARAQALVGSGYYFGASGYPQSSAEAARFYRLGAASNPIAQVNLGSMLRDGTAASDGKPAPGAAADYFRMAAAQGHPIGALNLGISYRDGTGVRQDYAEAARLFAEAAQQGNTQAQYELGRAYGLGYGVEQDLDERDRLYEAAAAQGHADALYAIASNAALDNLAEREAIEGPFYERDLEDPEREVSDEEMAEWEEAQQELDELDLFVVTLYFKAFQAYEREAAAGSTYAMRRIGDMHYQGEGVPQDYEAAFASYTKASDGGDLDGLFAVALLTQLGQGVPKDEAAAVKIYRSLADREFARAELNLGWMTESGLGGIAPDHAEALRLYKLAAQHGSYEAQDYLRKSGESW